ncbi:hypothetical protein [Flavivirga jejuensis]|uniref:DUF3829 domain-containing protein n=1 Tax=Flavivirga jejuensis TaxID=870487 RepID=A0ABT8WUS0_9FLAO|nr:hypothetical protein [Flavivirga jejuensis]MDO5976920.1 hypothetical protein [Flavivirga jejuensis]
MKIIKIIFTITVISALGYFAWENITSNPPPPSPPPSEPGYIKRIEKEIDSLGKMPNHTFSHEFYKAVQYRIDDYHRQRLLGKGKTNDKWQDILSKDLYATYTDKFIDQAKAVFNNEEWPNEDLRFIKREMDTLRSSTYLQSDGKISIYLDSINLVLSKYYEVNRFLSSCKRFRYSSYNLDDQFPDVRNKLKTAKMHLRSGIGSFNLNNCMRLKNGLRNIPQMLLDKHISYLHNKIKHHSNRYQNFEYHTNYYDQLYMPLNKQLKVLKNKSYWIYNNTYRQVYIDLNDLLRTDNRKAYDFFQLKNNN